MGGNVTKTKKYFGVRDSHGGANKRDNSETGLGGGIRNLYGNWVRLEIIQGDISNLKNTNCIVNFIVKDDVNGKLGLMEAAGDTVKKEYEEKVLVLNRNSRQSDFIVTSAGKLPYKAIFHIKVYAESAKFEVALHRALRQADNMGMRSIALPALKDKSQADSCLQVLYDFERRVNPCCLHMIDIVADNKTDDYYDDEMTKRGEELHVAPLAQPEYI